MGRFAFSPFRFSLSPFRQKRLILSSLPRRRFQGSSFFIPSHKGRDEKRATQRLLVLVTDFALLSPVGGGGQLSKFLFGKAPPEKGNLFKIVHSIEIFRIDAPYVHCIQFILNAMKMTRSRLVSERYHFRYQLSLPPRLSSHLRRTRFSFFPFLPKPSQKKKQTTENEIKLQF